MTAQKPNTSKEIRHLELAEVCALSDWLDKYMRLELVNPKLTDSDQLLHVLVRSSREYHTDLGVFGVDEN